MKKLRILESVKKLSIGGGGGLYFANPLSSGNPKPSKFCEQVGCVFRQFDSVGSGLFISMEKRASKRRKWDVAAPAQQQVPANNLGQQVQLPAMPTMFTVNPDALKGIQAQATNKPIDQSTIERAKQGAAAILERFNQVNALSSIPVAICCI